MKRLRLEDLTEQERKAIGQKYADVYKDEFAGVVELIAKAVAEQDRLLFLFVAESVNGLLQHGMRELTGDNEPRAKVIRGWPTTIV